MGEFVGDQAAPGPGAGLVLAGAERDVGTDGKGAGVQLSRGRGGGTVGVDADAAEVGPGSILEEGTLDVRERPTPVAHLLDPRLDVGGDLHRSPGGLAGAMDGFDDAG